MNNWYEQRVAALKAEGISPSNARRIALQEVRVLNHGSSEEHRKDARRSQANVRIGISVIKSLIRLAK